MTELMKKMTGLLFLLLSLGVAGQESIHLSGMTFTYQINDDQLICTMEAPTQGWVGVGFNDRNSIVGSDLLLFHIVDGKVSGTDLHVVSAGNPVKDEKLGGRNDITINGGEEK